MSDFNTDVKFKKSNNLAASEYKDIIVGWLEEDRRHHTKQRHTSTRIHARLKETCEGFKLSYNSINKYVITLKKEVYQLHNGFLPLTHPAGEAQVDFGECSYTYKNNKLLGYFCVMTFPYSNASYCQLMKAKNSECVFLALRNIFEYIGGVPHTIWFDNDAALVRVVKKATLSRHYSDLFTRFNLHYNFKEVFCAPNKCNEKGSVETAIRYIRCNLLVPVPTMYSMTTYNKELLIKSAGLHDREHYKLRTNICDLHFDDINALNALPFIPLEISSIKSRKLDCFGRVILDRVSYFISPILALERIQIKLTTDSVSFYQIGGDLILTTRRIYNNPDGKFINPIPYLTLLLNKPNAVNNFDITDILPVAQKKRYLKAENAERLSIVRDQLTMLKTHCENN